jgi:hypothetical protein
MRDYRGDLFDVVGGKIRGQWPDRNRVTGSDLGGSAGLRAVPARAEPDPLRPLPVAAGRAATGPTRLGAVHRGNHPSIAGKSSESLMKLVNRADYAKAESKPAGARWPRRLRANGNRGRTARRGRVYRA